MAINLKNKFDRLSTIWHSFRKIYGLSPEQVNAFLNSYQIYEYDWVNGQAMKDSEKLEYDQIKANIINYYSVLNYLCAIAQVEKMYIPPTMDQSVGLMNNQILFEKHFSQLLDMKPGDKVFELGCGKGRVAAHLASLTGSHITGINIDSVQLDDAKAFIKKIQLSNQCQFINADLNAIPFNFPDNYFDSIYEIQAFTYSRNLENLFIELFRVLKPGGKLSLLDWVRLPKYDESNPHHVALLKKIKPLIGAISTPSPAEYEAALQKAGFEVLISENPSINKSQLELAEQSAKIYDKFYFILKGLVKIKLLPAHIISIIDRFGKDVDAFYEADKVGLTTTSYHIVAQKPGA